MQANEKQLILVKKDMLRTLNDFFERAMTLYSCSVNIEVVKDESIEKTLSVTRNPFHAEAESLFNRLVKHRAALKMHDTSFIYSEIRQTYYKFPAIQYEFELDGIKYTYKIKYDIL